MFSYFHHLSSLLLSQLLLSQPIVLILLLLFKLIIATFLLHIQTIIINRIHCLICNNHMQLSQRNNSKKFGAPLIGDQHDIVVQNSGRSCTDILCLILFMAFFAAFIGLLTYGIISGNPRKVFTIYNSNQIRCDTTKFPYGYIPDASQLVNAVCVASCPTGPGQTIACLTDTVNCKTGTLLNTYDTFPIDKFCVPDVTKGGASISLFFDFNVYEAWAFDLKQGYLILVGAALAAMIASLLFLLVVRCCTGLIIWVAIFACIGGMLTMGIFFILQAKGVHISQYITNQLTSLTYDSLIIIGSSLIVGGVLFLILVICLRSRIAMGSKAVQLGAIFLFQNCYMIILPITQAIFVAGTIGGTIIGGIYLYSLGDISFPKADAFATISLTVSQIVMISFFLASGLWSMFFFHGCNHFMLCSSVSVWYFNNQSQYDLGNPFCDSFGRLIKFHIGTVAVTSLMNGIFFAVKIIAHIFSFQVKQDDHKCTALFLKCLNFLFCIFRIFLRFLSDGTYVQIAVFGKNYCSSTCRAFNLLSENTLKIGITDGISIFFSVMGILGISVGIAVAAYFTCLQVKYFALMLNNPLIVTLVSGLIAFVISCIYLSMIDLSAQSVMQCYLIDHQHHNGHPRYARTEFTEVMMIQK